MSKLCCCFIDIDGLRQKQTLCCDTKEAPEGSITMQVQIAASGKYKLFSQEPGINTNPIGTVNMAGLLEQWTLKSTVTRPVTFFCTKTNSQCIAYSGVIPEPLLTHDPSRSRF